MIATTWSDVLAGLTTDLAAHNANPNDYELAHAVSIHDGTDITTIRPRTPGPWALVTYDFPRDLFTAYLCEDDQRPADRAADRARHPVTGYVRRHRFTHELAYRSPTEAWWIVAGWLATGLLPDETHDETWWFAY